MNQVSLLSPIQTNINNLCNGPLSGTTRVSQDNQGELVPDNTINHSLTPYFYGYYSPSLIYFVHFLNGIDV